MLQATQVCQREAESFGKKDKKTHLFFPKQDGVNNLVRVEFIFHSHRRKKLSSETLLEAEEQNLTSKIP